MIESALKRMRFALPLVLVLLFGQCTTPSFSFTITKTAWSPSATSSTSLTKRKKFGRHATAQYGQGLFKQQDTVASRRCHQHGFLLKAATASSETRISESEKEQQKVEGEDNIGNVVFLIPSKGSDVTKAKFGHNSPVGEPSIQAATDHLINKLFWCSDGRIGGKVLTPEQVASSSDIKAQALQANCLVAFHLNERSDLGVAEVLFQSRKEALKNDERTYPMSQFAVECGPPSSSSSLASLVGSFDSANPSFIAKTFPWTTSASQKRLVEQMESLFARLTSDDFTTAILLYFQGCTPPSINIPWVQYSIDATWEKGPVQNAKELITMVDKCGDCITKCVADETCRTCLETLTELDTRDQVASYRTIVSFESELLRDFSLCILQKNNVFQCDAKIPTLPFVPAIIQWRGKDLTQEDARQILIGHLDDEDAAPGIISNDQRGPISWKVACGANVAYDQFPSQNQIFYKSTNGKDMWYDPVFRVETIDGRHIWAKRHYKVRDGGSTPGTFRFSVLDNGVTSNEFWTIAGVADDLSWIVFHYAGAASAVGQRYLGGLLCTADGSMPPPEQVQEAWKALKKTGIEPWELFIVNNDPHARGMDEAGAAPLNFYRKTVMAAKEKRGAAR
jgi:hypothetical protein